MNKKQPFPAFEILTVSPDKIKENDIIILRSGKVVTVYEIAVNKKQFDMMLCEGLPNDYKYKKGDVIVEGLTAITLILSPELKIPVIRSTENCICPKCKLENAFWEDQCFDCSTPIR